MIYRPLGRLVVAAAAALLAVVSLVACNTAACSEDLLGDECLSVFNSSGPPLDPTLRATVRVYNLAAYPGQRLVASLDGHVEIRDNPSEHLEFVTFTFPRAELTDPRLVVWIDFDRDAECEAGEPAWVRGLGGSLEISAFDPVSPGC